MVESLKASELRSLASLGHFAQNLRYRISWLQGGG